MQRGKDTLRQRPADPRHLCQIVDARRLHAPESAEVREQRLAALGPDPADLLQRRGRACLATPGAVALDRETVRLVAYLLVQVQPRMSGRYRHRPLAFREEYVLEGA